MIAIFDWFRMILLFGGWLGSITFVVYYHLTARWYRDPLSRYLMSGPLGLFSLYTSAMVNMFISNETVRDILRMFMILSAFAFAWYSVLTYHRMRRQVRREKREEKMRKEGHAKE